MIEPNLKLLGDLYITPKDLIIWKLYEYQHQCSMAFCPKTLKHLGELGIALNIDCWKLKETKTNP